MIAEKLKDLRKSADLLQTDMAAIVGCSTGTISNIENGRDPDLDVLRAYCKHFNVTADYILDLSQDPRPVSGDINAKLSFLHQVSGKDTILTEDLLGLILALVIVCIQYFRDDMYKTADDIRKYTGLANLAVVPMSDTLTRKKNHRAKVADK